MVLSWDAFPNVTVPGPVTWLQVVVKLPGGFGSPSSEADPDKFPELGSVMVWSDPAFTLGGRLKGPDPWYPMGAVSPSPSGHGALVKLKSADEATFKVPDVTLADPHMVTAFVPFMS